MKRMLCWFAGHRLMAHVVVYPTHGFVYSCRRCNRVLPQPRLS